MKCRKCFIFAALLVALVIISAVPTWAAGTKKFALGNVNIKSLRYTVVVAADWGTYADTSEDIFKLYNDISADIVAGGASKDEYDEWWSILRSSFDMKSSDFKADSSGIADHPTSKDMDTWITALKTAIDNLNKDNGSDGDGGGESSNNTDSNNNNDNDSDGDSSTGDGDTETPTTDATKEALDALSDGSPETEKAIEEAYEAANQAGVTITPEDAPAYVNNIKAINQEAEVELNQGVVGSVEVPAATNLVADVEALSALTTTPKVTKPAALEASDQQQAEATLTASGVDASDIKAATPENITIGDVSNSLEEQTSIIIKLLEEIAEALTKVTASDGAENGVAVATTLPSLAPKTDGYYPMKVNLRHVVPGRKVRFWTSTSAIKSAAGVASVSLSEAEEGSYFFLDENGNDTKGVVKGDAAKMTVVPYLKGGTTYGQPFITVDATADEQKALGSYAAAEPETPETSSSGGGCNAGFATCGLAAAALLLTASKKRS